MAPTPGLPDPPRLSGAGGNLYRWRRPCSRFFIAKTKGIHRPGLSVEDVRDHLDEIRDEAGYTVPDGSGNEMSELFATIMAGLSN